MLSFRANGDMGLTVILGDVITRATAMRVLTLRRAVEAARIKGVRETTPAYCTLLVHYDPLETNHAALKKTITEIADTITDTDTETLPDSRTHEIPVSFEGQTHAPDLPAVAAWAKMPQAEIIAALTATPLFVYMIGFAPGMPYMGDLPRALAIPRRKTPIPRAPAGSVLIAAGKAIIYPVAMPTGWHIIGTTPMDTRLTDTANPPFAPGDRVVLREISRKEFEAVRA